MKKLLTRWLGADAKVVTDERLLPLRRLAALATGSLGDRYGRKLMLVRATIGGAIFLALMGFAQSAS